LFGVEYEEVEVGLLLAVLWKVKAEEVEGGTVIGT
jgi:hypothetical protein